MRHIHATLAALVTCAAASHPPAAFAQTIAAGRTIEIKERKLEFEKPVNACLKLCTNVVVERQTFECNGYFEPAYEGCRLPGIDSENPNPLLGPEEWCVPSENEFGGFALSERVQRIERRVRQDAACQTVVTETVLEDLPPRNNPPRPCPDPGPWDWSDETVLSIQFVACR
jgi:hypothetical protein